MAGTHQLDGYSKGSTLDPMAPLLTHTLQTIIPPRIPAVALTVSLCTTVSRVSVTLSVTFGVTLGVAHRDAW